MIVYSCGETRVFDEQAQRPKYRKGELVKWSFADLPARHEKCTEYPHICLHQGKMKMTALCKRYESCVNEALLCI